MILIVIACLLRLYRIGYLYPQPFISAFSTFLSAVLYCPRFILFLLKWSYPKSWPLRCTILPILQVWCHLIYRDIQAYLEVSYRGYHITFTYIGILLKCFVIAHDKCSYIIIKTVINHNVCCSLWFYCCAYALFFWSSYCHSSVFPWWTLIVYSPVNFIYLILSFILDYLIISTKKAPKLNRPCQVDRWNN